MTGGDVRTAVLVFSGYNNRAVIAFVRTLQMIMLDYAIVARDEQDPILHTEYRDNVISIRESLELTFTMLLHSVSLAKKKFKAKNVLIAPSTEALNRFLLEKRDELEAHDVIVPLPTSDIYVRVSDKAAFGDTCKSFGIKVPEEFTSIAAAPIPFVAKPRMYISSDGKAYSPVIVMDDDQRRAFCECYDPADFYFQQYVEGQSFYLLYYFSREGTVYQFSQENIAQQPAGKSILAAKSSRYHENCVSKQYEKLFKRMDFTGLVMVEIRVCEGVDYMVEANPRFWGPSQLFVDAGYNFFECLLHDYGLCKELPDLSRPSESRYFWFGGMIETIKTGNSVSFLGNHEEKFYSEMESWLANDVYKRRDTMGVFGREMN